MTSNHRRPARAHGSLGVFLGALALGLAAALGATGCSGSGIAASERGPEAYKPLTASFATLGYRWDWSGFPAPTDEDRILFIEAYPDIVVTQDSGSKVVVVEAASGRVRWANQLATRATRFLGPVRDKDPSRGDRLLVCSEAEAFVLDAHTGNLVGRQHFEKVVNTRPTLVGPVAWIGTPHGEIYGHLFTRNVRVSGFKLSGPIEQPPTQVGGAIAAVSQEGVVAFLDASGGSLLGRTKIYGGTASRPVGGDSVLYVASLDQSLYAFAINGQTLWRKRTSSPLRAQPTLVGPTLYCEIPGQGLTAFDALTGHERWSNPEITGTVIAVRKKRLLVWDGKAMLLVDPENGGTIERAELPGVVNLAVDKFEDGVLYAVNRGGVVGRFLPQ